VDPSVRQRSDGADAPPPEPVVAESPPDVIHTPSGDVFERHLQFKFLSARRFDVYEPIVQLFYENRQRSGMAMTTAEVERALHERFGLRFGGVDELDAHLAQLRQWRLLKRDRSSGKVGSLEEFYRGRFSWDLTHDGVQIVRFVLEVFQPGGDPPGTLGPERLRNIHHELAALIDDLDSPAPDPGEVQRRLTNLGAAVGALRDGVLAFMSTLASALTTSDAIDPALFAAYKIGVVEHLEDFRAARRRYADAIVSLIEKIETRDGGVDRLVRLAVEAEGAYDYRRSAGEAVAAREEEFRRIWRGVRDWFVGSGTEESPWHLLGQALRDAIRWILQAVRRLREQHAERTDAVSEFLALARLFHAQADEAACHALAHGTLGLSAPRHFSYPEPDPEPTAGRGWLEVADDELPVIPISLRSPDRAPPRGRSARIPDTSEARRRARAERERREREACAVLERLGGLGSVRISRLPELSRTEFDYLRGWLGDALAAESSADGRRVTITADGLARIAVRGSPDGAGLASLQVEDGLLHGPDFEIEVRAA